MTTGGNSAKKCRVLQIIRQRVVFENRRPIIVGVGREEVAVYQPE
jgi:hypothetical protein